MLYAAGIKIFSPFHNGDTGAHHVCAFFMHRRRIHLYLMGPVLNGLCFGQKCLGELRVKLHPARCLSFLGIE